MRNANVALNRESLAVTAIQAEEGEAYIALFSLMKPAKFFIE